MNNEEGQGKESSWKVVVWENTRTEEVNNEEGQGKESSWGAAVW